jgi:hypothetical protein
MHEADLLVINIFLLRRGITQGLMLLKEVMFLPNRPRKIGVEVLISFKYSWIQKIMNISFF